MMIAALLLLAQAEILLPATSAELRGPSLKINPDTQVAGWWKGPEDRATWKFTVVKAAAYDVRLTWGVPAADAGQPFVVELDGKIAIETQVGATAGYADFRQAKIGKLELTAGEHTLTFRPARAVKGDDLLDLREVMLSPPGAVRMAFSVPEGHTISLAAGPPLVERPIMASFDDRGRLYVADSAGINHNGKTLLKDPPHTIRLLEDTDGDGVFDTSKVFADKLVFPQGLLWHDGAVYCVSPPALWKLEDTDGDGTCDRRTELVTGMALTGVADDAHGCILGPDGRLYFLPGRMHHKLRLKDGTPFKDAVGPWLMRCRFDGTDVEIVSGTQGNPVEVDFTPEGDVFASGTFWAPDSFGGGLRDALVHCVEGGEYPVRDRVYNDRIRTGDLLPVLVPMIATAPSGMMIARADGKQDTIYCTYFNTRRVQRHRLTRDGATFKATTEDFALATHGDVHPTDVLEDADGSILVVDTGGWFRIGCPTSQIAKPQVLGGIYRIRRTADAPPADPRGLKAAWDDPAKLLDDPRWVVRERAIRETAARGKVPAMPATERGRRNALWALCRIDTPEASAAIRGFLAEPGLHQVAAYAAGLRRDAAATDALINLLRDPQASVRREAATALGRIKDARSVPALLAALREKPDRFLEHALIYALIRIGDPATREGLSDPLSRRGALIALDQMGRLDVATALAQLRTGDRQTALDILRRHRDWGDAIADAVEPSMDPELLTQVLRGHLANARVQALVATLPRDLMLGLMNGHDKAPAVWIEPLRLALDSPDAAAALSAVERLRPPGLEAALSTVASGDHPVGIRLRALRARGGLLDAEFFRFVQEQAGEEGPTPETLLAVQVLGEAALTPGQLGKLLPLVRAAGPIDLPTLLTAFEKGAPSPELAAALEQSPGVWAVHPDRLKKWLRENSPVFQGRKPDAERLAALEALPAGDGERGRALFFAKATCHVCHAVEGKGGVVGPDLSKIGAIRARRDLLEAVAFPSASFARGFEPVMVTMKDGSTHFGRAGTETPDVVEIVDAQGRTLKLKRAEIFQVTPNRISVMPEGLDRLLSPAELGDLVAFLEGRR